MFWSDVTLDSIKCSFMNGSAVREVVSVGLESPGKKNFYASLQIVLHFMFTLPWFTDSNVLHIMRLTELKKRELQCLYILVCCNLASVSYWCKIEY